MPTACRGLRVRDLFAPFWNPGMYWYVLVCTCMCLYVRVHTFLYWNVLVCTCHTGSFGMNQYVLVHTCTNKYILVQPGTYVYVLYLMTQECLSKQYLATSQ